MSFLLGRAALSAVAFMGLSVTAAALAGYTAIDSATMPGLSYSGKQAILTPKEETVSANIKRHIGTLAGRIGERNMNLPDNLAKAADYIETEWTRLGYAVKSQRYLADGKPVRNLEVELRGVDRPDEIVIVGAHYDSVPNCPGANDNASGIAGVLELSRLLKAEKPNRTLRFVAFTNEEDPYFGTAKMGSYQYAERCKKRGENIVGMMAVETVGYHSDQPKTQKLPPLCDLLYPSVGNFVWFVGNQQSKDLVHRCIKTFRDKTPYPSQGVAAPEWIEGVDWCDQLYFWKNGYPGLMVTDSAPYRYPHYHTPNDKPDKINYESTARIITGLSKVVGDLTKEKSI